MAPLQGWAAATSRGSFVAAPQAGGHTSCRGKLRAQDSSLHAGVFRKGVPTRCGGLPGLNHSSGRHYRQTSTSSLAMLGASEPRGAAETGRNVRAVTNDSECLSIRKQRHGTIYNVRYEHLQRLWNPSYRKEYGSEEHC